MWQKFRPLKKFRSIHLNGAVSASYIEINGTVPKNFSNKTVACEYTLKLFTIHADFLLDNTFQVAKDFPLRYFKEIPLKKKFKQPERVRNTWDGVRRVRTRGRFHKTNILQIGVRAVTMFLIKRTTYERN